ncbi:AMP-dependent synthetase/ligase [Spirochaeta africana]|uniref:AMP-forming long-chain acyl-CoA synthetase n=1 Tax=Spirochaeta africana (strain ATCC 700263 / DSM 8902 / Z-7692) TaxID=889378 RepID=H9UFA1_SPIAZ|nr:AMP-binding protein [Spirochaeta africana]AFG36194.1 AMP-forming long-chain acyl-CoA synthetase [Spirochaeta africana DSM 8902]
MVKTVLDMLQRAVERYPDRAYAFRKTEMGWTPKSFAQVQSESRSVAAALVQRGFAKNNTMAILSEGSPEWIVSEFATIMAGGAAVPLSIKLLANEVPFRLNHSESRGLFLSKNTAEKIFSVRDQIEDPNYFYVLLDDDPDFADQLAAENNLKRGTQLVTIQELAAEGAGSPDALRQVDTICSELTEDDIVTVSYTSGTTGNPKGIMLMHRNYIANSSEAIEVFRIPAGYQTLLILPCDHSFAHTVGIYASLVAGISLYFVDARGGSMAILRNIPGNLVETDPTFLLTVPALTGNFMKKIQNGVAAKGSFVNGIFERGIRAGIARNGDGYHQVPFLTRARHFLPWLLAELLVFRKVRTIFGKKVKFCVSGGALLDLGQQQFFHALGLPVYQGYGMTEASPIISSNHPWCYKLGTSGKPFPTVQVKVVLQDGSEAAPGEKGQICVRGPNVMKGYLKNPDATEEALRDGWLHTGDLGFLDADGFLTVSGREKALLISADGEKYSPEEIEEVMTTACPYISQAMLYNDHNRFTGALIVPDTDAVKKYLKANPDAGVEDVLRLFTDFLQTFRTSEDLKQRFPSNWVPPTFMLLDEPFSEQNGTINSTMKLVRYRVIEQYGDLLAYMYSDEGDRYSNPKNRAVVQQLFGLE